MMADWLAQSSKGVDWIQLLVILLVIGGSVFGAIAKKLIAFFTPDKDQSKPRSLSPPVFKKTTDRSTTTTTSAPPTARPVTFETPTAVILEEILTTLNPMSPAEMQKRRPVSPPQRRKKSTTKRSSQSRRAVSGKTPARQAAVSTSRRTTAQRLGTLTSSFEDEEKLIEARIEKNVGHLASSFDKPGHPSHEWGVDTSQDPSASTVRVRAIFKSPQTLRDAIILAEILAPPLAMREYDQGI